MAHDGKTQREAAQRLPPPVPVDRIGPAKAAAEPRDATAAPPPPRSASTPSPAPGRSLPDQSRDQARGQTRDQADDQANDVGRRSAKRRTAGPARAQVAANDDAPSIGGLIFALQQKPSNQSFLVASCATGGWLLIGALLAWGMLGHEIAAAPGIGSVLASPTMVIVLATIGLPIALFWFLALLSWRAQELKLMSSAMTEVAVRLAEPDRSAEQSAASLGQAVRRQVSFMNEAISRALGRAGELEALVHNEVALLEKSYGENEYKIKGLIQELVGERHALVSTTDKVAETLKTMGSDVPNLIEKLSQQQIKLAKIIEGAGQNLIALENKLTTASGSLETALSSRTLQLQAVLDDYTVALDATLANRAEALDVQLVERTRALDAAFSERLSLFDDSMLRSTMAIDQAVNEKARALTVAMENHVRALSDTMGRQAVNLDESMMHGIDAVRRTSDSITRQSLKAIEGLSGQADLLKNVSENLLHQVSNVTNRFDNQGQSIVSAASALESANMRIDSTLQKRHAELHDTLTRMSGKAEQLDEVMRGYSATVEGSLTGAEARARQLIQQLAQGTATHAQTALGEIERLRVQSDAHSQAVIAEFERLHAQTNAQSARAIEDMRARVTGVSHEVSQHLGSLANRFTETTEDVRAKAARAGATLQMEQERLRAEADRLPVATRESAEAMRAALNEQLRALEQLSSLAGRERRDITAPLPAAAGQMLPAGDAPMPSSGPASGPPSGTVSLTAAYAAQAQAGVQSGSAPAAENGERWSLGDLLARASRDDDGTTRAPVIDLENIARALDPTTASAIWSRFRAGQRGIMVRSIYTAEGRVTFDELSERYGRDMDFRRTADRFLTDFERLMRDVEQKNPRGVHDHLVSDAGRVYLFLAHASGRLR
jgi:ABC-type transporter Mla subunit MlaD